MFQKRRRTPVVTAVLAVAVGVLSLLPFVYLFAAGISLHTVAELFSYPNTASQLARTLGLTVSISALCVVIGVAAALLVVRTNIPFRRLLVVLFTLPLAIPGFVSAYAVYSGSLMVAPDSNAVTSFGGATVVLSLVLYPYVFLACVIAVRNVDPAQEEVARSLGLKRAAVFWRVVVPQLRPAIAGSVLIVALHVLSEYGAMVQLKQSTLTTAIMTNMIDYGDYEAARSLSLLLAALALIALAGGHFLTGRGGPNSLSSQTVRPATRARLGAWRIPALAAALVIPVAALGPTVAMTVHGLTSPHRAVTVSWGGVMQATGATLTFAVWAAVVATVVALPVSWLISRHPSAFATLTERSVWLAHSIPNAILALALVYLATQLVPALYKTSALLVVAYVILYLPLAVADQRVGLQASLVKFDEAAASLGARPWRTLLRVSLPIALPGVATGALIVGLDSAKELTTTLMLLPFNTQTLATGLWATTNGETLDFTAAAPYTVMLVVLGAIPVAMIVRRTLRYMA